MSDPHKTDHQKIAFRILYIASSIFVLILLFVFFGPHIDSHPFDHSLGDKMEYIGKEESNCESFCAASPDFDYYYATSMSTLELAQYFSQATAQPLDTSWTPYYLGFRTKDGGFFSLDYYPTNKAPDLDFTKNEKNTVRIHEKDYQTAKDSL